MSEKEKVFLLLAFSLLIAILPHQVYLPSNVVGAASQYSKYLNYSTSLNMMVTHSRYLNYSISLSIIHMVPPPPPPSGPPSQNSPPPQVVPPPPSSTPSQSDSPGVVALIQAIANQIITNPILDLGILIILFLVSITSLSKRNDPRKKYRGASYSGTSKTLRRMLRKSKKWVNYG